VVPSIVEGIASIRQLGHAVLIAESNLHHVPDFADRLYVMERGEIIFSGPPADARKDPRRCQDRRGRLTSCRTGALTSYRALVYL
jgi:ABC-type branched-subunit amino acid transport system ATPase component